MASIGGQDFVRGTEAGQQATLIRFGAVTLVALVVAVTAIGIWYPRYTEPDGIEVTLAVDRLGPGVTTGTKVMLRGTEVGEVTDVSPQGIGPIDVNMRVRDGDVTGLTDSFAVDFRPRNYFGTTAISLAPRPGGQPVTDGLRVRRDNAGDFTMSTMLLQGSLVVDGSLTRDMIASLDKAIHYTSAMTPMVESGILLADQVAKTQKLLPSDQLEKFNDVLTELPPFSRQLVQLLDAIYTNDYNKLPDGGIGVDDAFMDKTDDGLTLASGELFGLAGALLKSKGPELTPLTHVIAEAVDVIPHLILNGVGPAAVESLVDRYTSVFDERDGKPVLKLRVVLGQLPALASSISAGAIGKPSTGRR